MVFSDVMSGIETVLTRASTNSESLRTTLPLHLVKQFDLEAGDKLSWEFLTVGGELKIVVSPVKK